MTHEEKIHLMNSAFEGVHDDENEEGAVMDDRREIVVPNGLLQQSASESTNEDGEEEEDEIAMFGEDDDGSDDDGDGDDEKDSGSSYKPPHKRRKTDEAADVSKTPSEAKASGESKQSLDKKTKPMVVLSQKQQEQLDLAKNKLSKWAARLFDPNRPRGLVEAPQVIPLNDEFLTAFGKREKDYDNLAGREIDIDKTSLDAIDGLDSDDEVGREGKTGKKRNFGEMSNCKVKITNLAYGTSTATIARAFEQVGPVVDVNLILDDNRQSTGRAYVLFETHETAEACVKEMNEKALDGRVLRISLASASLSGRKKEEGPGGGGGGGGNSGVKRKDNRYWERDISIKCNHCQGVGHTMANCPNGDESYRPCGLCAELGHEMWSCPQKAVCFNCGVPGHVSRECRRGRMSRKRMLCTICYSNDHHRWDCHERPWNTPTQDAVCMECGKIGHLMCSEMRWFFGLTGLTCFNCGRNDHHGNQCKRPTLDVCAKNPDTARREIEMADAISL